MTHTNWRREVVVIHRESHTLIVTDLAFNFGEKDGARGITFNEILCIIRRDLETKGEFKLAFSKTGLHRAKGVGGRVGGGNEAGVGGVGCEPWKGYWERWKEGV